MLLSIAGYSYLILVTITWDTPVFRTSKSECIFAFVAIFRDYFRIQLAICRIELENWIRTIFFITESKGTGSQFFRQGCTVWRYYSLNSVIYHWFSLEPRSINHRVPMIKDHMKFYYFIIHLFFRNFFPIFVSVMYQIQIHYT